MSKRCEMTARYAASAADAPTIERFPDFPPRDDMQNPLHLYRPGFITALDIHFGSSPTTFVLSETPIGWRPSGSRAGILIPDLMIAFDVDPDVIISQRGYSIDEHGKPPDFVLEVASPSTGRRDYTDKRAGYADFGVPEHWLFDSSGGRYHLSPLSGDSLADGAYRPIPIERVDENRLRGRSEVLGLDLCWEYGSLRWWDPVSESYLPTHREDNIGRAEERQGRIAAERERVVERQGRIEAERERAEERQGRISAEAEAERLREQLRRMQQDRS